MNILFTNDDDRMAVYDAMRRHIDCGVMTLHMTHNRLYQVQLSAAAVSILPRVGLRHHAYALDVDFVHIRHVEPVEAPEDTALLRAQLAARDTALDAVLELATNEGYHPILSVLLKHGVHPK